MINRANIVAYIVNQSQEKYNSGKSDSYNGRYSKIMENEMTYTKAMQELEAIVAKMQSDSCDIDALAGYTKRAAELIKFCREKLFKTDEEVKKCIESLTSIQ